MPIYHQFYLLGLNYFQDLLIVRPERLKYQRKTQMKESLRKSSYDDPDRFYQLYKFQFFSYFLVDLLGFILNSREPEGHHTAC